METLFIVSLRVIMRSYFRNSCFMFHWGIQTSRNNENTWPSAFICFSVYGYPTKTLNLVLEIVLITILSLLLLLLLKCSYCIVAGSNLKCQDNCVRIF